MNKPLLSLLALASTAVPAHAVIANFSTTSNPSPNTFFEFVGQVGDAPGAPDNFTSSGVAVGTRKVLTAKHVVGSGFFLGVGAADAVRYDIVGRVDHPTADLSVLTVSADLPGFYGITLSNLVAEQAQVIQVGYGPTGRVSTDGTRYIGDPSTKGNRYAGFNVVEARQTLDLTPAGINATASTSLLTVLDGAQDALTTSGDSGGGWFTIDGGTPLLAAISSVRFDDGTNPPQFAFGRRWGSAAVELRSYQEFLTQNGVALPVPEPASMLILGGALGALALRRRKR